MGTCADSSNVCEFYSPERGAAVVNPDEDYNAKSSFSLLKTYEATWCAARSRDDGPSTSAAFRSRRNAPLLPRTNATERGQDIGRYTWCRHVILVLVVCLGNPFGWGVFDLIIRGNKSLAQLSLRTLGLKICSLATAYKPRGPVSTSSPLISIGLLASSRSTTNIDFPEHI